MKQNRRSFLQTCGTLGAAAGCSAIISASKLSAGVPEKSFGK